MTFNIDTGGFTPRIEIGTGEGFAKHGIGHLSASSLNLWKNAPDVWVAKYLAKMKSSFGSAPVRGQCVEDAVVAALLGESITAAIAKGLDRFDNTFPSPTDADLKERAMIADMTKIAVDELKEYGTPEFDDNGQKKISIRAAFDGWEIKVIGFLDLVFPKHGLVVDLKTTSRVPSSMSADHRLQRCIYAKACNNMAVKFLYVSTKKAAWLEDGDVNETLARAKHSIARLERFLAHHDAQSAVTCVPHNPDSFYWRGDESARHEIYGS